MPIKSRSCRLKLCSSDAMSTFDLDWSGRTETDQRHSSRHCLLVSWGFFSELAPIGGLMTCAQKTQICRNRSCCARSRASGRFCSLHVGEEEEMSQTQWLLEWPRCLQSLQSSSHATADFLLLGSSLEECIACAAIGHNHSMEGPRPKVWNLTSAPACRPPALRHRAGIAESSMRSKHMVNGRPKVLAWAWEEPLLEHDLARLRLP